MASAGKFKIYSLMILLLVACSSVASRQSAERTLAASDVKLFGNQIRPFRSDGCSGFISGIPFVDDRKWLHCCVQHDVLYWAGGTRSDRDQADQGLRACVAATGETGIAEVMYQAVRIVGDAGVPMTWRWGYGWKIERGYEPLSSVEQEYVRVEKEKIPKDLAQVVVVPSNVIDQRPTVTGDYCLDMAIERIEAYWKREFQIVKQSESLGSTRRGWLKTLKIQTDGCSADFKFVFQIKDKNDCKKTMDELSARERIQLYKTELPMTCSPPAVIQ